MQPPTPGVTGESTHQAYPRPGVPQPKRFIAAGQGSERSLVEAQPRNHSPATAQAGSLF
jgi:hypothetical protein